MTSEQNANGTLSNFFRVKPIEKFQFVPYLPVLSTKA